MLFMLWGGEHGLLACSRGAAILLYRERRVPPSPVRGSTEDRAGGDARGGGADGGALAGMGREGTALGEGEGYPHRCVVSGFVSFRWDGCVWAAALHEREANYWSTPPCPGSLSAPFGR